MNKTLNNSELEIKLACPPNRQETLKAELLKGGAKQTQLVAEYFDTADGLLAGHSIALRVRKEGDQWVQTLKAASKKVAMRFEHNVVLEGVSSSGPAPAPDLSLHEGTPAGRQLREVLGRRHGKSGKDALLVRRFMTDVHRSSQLLSLQQGEVELSFDEGVITAGDRTVPVIEVEIELKGGSPQAVFEVAQEWVPRYGLWLDMRSKSERGESLACGQQALKVVRAETPDLDRGMFGESIACETVRCVLRQILGNASAIGAGSADPDHIHQLRVGIRRMRTVLREMGRLSPGLDVEWDGPLADTFRALGELRDRETVIQGLVPTLMAAGARPVHLSSTSNAPSAAYTVQDPQFQLVLLRMMAFTESKDDVEPASQKSNVLRRIASRLNKLHREVVRDGRQFETLVPAAQHRVRKRLKRLRYLAEFVAPLFQRHEVERYLKTLRPAQEALGAHNDAEVAIEAFGKAATDDSGAWFGVGWLVAGRGARAAASRKTLRKVEDAKRFWK